MPKRSQGASGHYFSRTGHQEAYRDYCLCCANYRTLQQYFTGEYYCRSCTAKINRGLRGKRIFVDHVQWDQCNEQERQRLIAAVDAVVDAIQKALPADKTTERDFRSSWRPVKKKKSE